VICELCPSEHERFRDNGRLKAHLKKEHGITTGAAEKWVYRPIEKPDNYRRGFWQDYSAMWNEFCPNEPIPQSQRKFFQFLNI